MSGSAQVGHLYNKNRIGPKTDPRGTPDVTEIWDEVPLLVPHTVCDPTEKP